MLATEIRTFFAWAPDWAVSLALLAAGVLLGLAVHKVALAVLRPVVRRHGLLPTAMTERIQGQARLGLAVGGLALAATAAPLSTEARSLLQQLLLIAFVLLVGWAALSALHVATIVYSRRFKVEVADNLLARKHLTQVRILEHAGAALIVMITIGAALMTLPAVRQYGVTLLASAGAAGIIAGLALQPLLTNLIAGVQIALTQPIRIDDAVIVENEWGWVEEIGATYVVVRLWDWRRMILPLSYFIQKPFQNWTRETSSLIGTAMIYVDYSAPIERLRTKLDEIARGSRLWDGDVANLQVTDLTERTMQVRCLVSARNAGDAFDLRCEVREKMIAFLQTEHPDALPRERMLLPDWAAAAGGEARTDGGRPNLAS